MKTNSFLSGFAVGAQLNESEADEQWAGFSRSLSDSERSAIEAGGYQAGVAEGEKFLTLYPVADRDETFNR